MAVHGHDRSEAAASQAGHFVYREQAPSVGVGALGDGEMAAQLLGNLSRAGDVAGRSVAHSHHVFADGRAAELAVEGRRAGHLRGRNFSQLAEAVEGFVGKIAVVGLDGLEEDDGRFFAASFPGDELVYQGEVKRGGDRSLTVAARLGQWWRLRSWIFVQLLCEGLGDGWYDSLGSGEEN